ncbi:MAG: hypothetical protein Q9O62_03365 [Ardenticatenia bacterium]|nr:hypothetical protein [Ardenticatenia bacterium]
MLLTLSVLGTLFSVGTLLIAGRQLDVAGKQVSSPEEELVRTQKRANALLVRVRQGLQDILSSSAVLVSVERLDDVDVLRLAEELWRPVLCTVQRGKVIYWVVDVTGSICYPFVSQSENP